MSQLRAEVARLQAELNKADVLIEALVQRIAWAKARGFEEGVDAALGSETYDR